jgi:hypothetical protein
MEFTGYERLLLLFFFHHAIPELLIVCRMEQIPQTQELTAEQIHERLGQIDKAIFALTGSLDGAPAEFQESSQGDDDAVESESTEQKLARIRSQIEALGRERDELHARLEAFEKKS